MGIGSSRRRHRRQQRMDSDDAETQQDVSVENEPAAEEGTDLVTLLRFLVRRYYFTVAFSI